MKGMHRGQAGAGRAKESNLNNMGEGDTVEGAKEEVRRERDGGYTQEKGERST